MSITARVYMSFSQERLPNRKFRAKQGEEAEATGRVVGRCVTESWYSSASHKQLGGLDRQTVFLLELFCIYSNALYFVAVVGSSNQSSAAAAACMRSSDFNPSTG